jgi:EF-hand domain pair
MIHARRPTVVHGSEAEENAATGLERMVELAREHAGEREEDKALSRASHAWALRRRLREFLAARGRRGRALAERMDREDDELALMRRWFAFLDADGSGALDVDELEEPLTGMGLVLSREEVLQLIREVDRDESGELDFDEFRAVLRGVERKDRKSAGGAAGAEGGAPARPGRKKVGPARWRRAEDFSEGTERGEGGAEGAGRGRGRRSAGVAPEGVLVTCAELKRDLMREASGDRGAGNVLQKCFDALLNGEAGDPEELDLGTILLAFRRRILVTGLVANYRGVEDDSEMAHAKTALQAIERLMRRRVREGKVAEIKKRRAERRALRRNLREYLNGPGHGPARRRPTLLRGSSWLDRDEVAAAAGGASSAAPPLRTDSDILRNLAFDDSVARAGEAEDGEDEEEEDGEEGEGGAGGGRKGKRNPAQRRYETARKALGELAKEYVEDEGEARLKRLRPGVVVEGAREMVRPIHTVLRTGMPGIAPHPRHLPPSILPSKAKKEGILPPILQSPMRPAPGARRRRSSLAEDAVLEARRAAAAGGSPRGGPGGGELPSFYAKTVALRRSIGLPPQRYMVERFRAKTGGASQTSGTTYSATPVTPWVDSIDVVPVDGDDDDATHARRAAAATSFARPVVAGHRRASLVGEQTPLGAELKSALTFAPNAFRDLSLRRKVVG